MYRVCSFESRRNVEMARLIEKSGGISITAPSLREIPVSDNTQVYAFADQLLSDQIDAVIFLTGVGTDALMEVLALRDLKELVIEKLKTLPILVRGPKPFAALSKLGVKSTMRAPEPNTWQDLVKEMQRNHFEVHGKRIAVQEYGEASEEFYDWLRTAGVDVIAVPVYRWALPEDLVPLQQAIQQTIDGQLEILLWTSAQQINHTFQVAQQMGAGVVDRWKAAANRCVIGSIGPTSSERLKSFGIPADLEPSHPKMAHLIRETLAATPEILLRKRGVDS